MFRKENFYNLSREQQIQLCQAVVNDYCKSNGVKPCKIKLAELPMTDKKICYGEFMPAKSTILLNSKVFEIADDLKYSKNSFLPLQILLTTVHEAQHRVQVEKLGQVSESLRDQTVSECIKNPVKNISFSHYLASADELDARDCALEYIKQQLPVQNCTDLEKFFNTKILEEKRNTKKDIPDEIKAMFPNIYFEQVTKRGFDLEASQRSYITTLREIFNEQEKIKTL